ncbi:MAG: hypothetical protein JNJ88_15120 [Planctomycetes bacterium]|nr:hypothetical protein [Planctomycetota bacterium]
MAPLRPQNASVAQPASRVASLWLGVGAAVGGFLLGALFPHRGIYNDGIFFVQWLSDWTPIQPDREVWLYPHLLYIPLAKLFHEAASALLGLRIDESLKLFSAVCLGAAGPFLVRFFTALMSAPRAAFATALVLLSPSVWFFAGATEIHTLHLLGVSLAISMAVRPCGCRPLLGFAAAGAAVVGTHLSGILLLPAIILLHVRTQRRTPTPASPSWVRVAFAFSLGAATMWAVAGAVHWLATEHSILVDYFRAVHPAEQPYFETILQELWAQSGVLAGAGLLAGIFLLIQDRALAFAILASLAGYAHMIGSSRVEYTGGYNIGVLPLLAAGVAQLFPRWRGAPLAVAAIVLVCTQAFLAWPQVSKAHRSENHRDVAEALAARIGKGSALLLFLRSGVDVEFNAPELKNLTRLYIGPEVLNLAELDEPGPFGVDPVKSIAETQRAMNRVDTALRAGHKAYVQASALQLAAERPYLQRCIHHLTQKYEIGPPDDAGLCEVRAKPE